MDPVPKQTLDILSSVFKNTLVYGSKIDILLRKIKFWFEKKSEHFRALAVFPVDRKSESKLVIFPLISKMELFEQHDDGPGFVGIRFCKEW